MDNIERIIIPLTIVAAVVGIWASLRKPTASTVVVDANPAPSSGVSIPSVAPVSFGSAPDSSSSQIAVDPASTTGYDAGSGIATDPTYIAAGYGSPQSQAPIPGGPITANGSGQQTAPAYPSGYNDGYLPKRYTAQLPPWSNGPQHAVAQAAGVTAPSPAPQPAAATKSASGSHGGCGCGAGGKSQSNPMLEGGGSYFQPIYQPPSVQPATLVNAAIYTAASQPVTPAASLPAAD